MNRNPNYYNQHHPNYSKIKTHPHNQFGDNRKRPYVVEKDAPNYTAHYSREVANIEVHQGEVYIVDLPTTRGTEEGGKRPCVVISSDRLNRWSTVVWVVPLTRQVGNISRDMHYPFVWKDKSFSVALCNHARELDKEFLLDKAGYVDKMHIHSILHIIKERVLQEDYHERIFNRL